MSNIPKQLPYADEVNMEVLWSLYKLVEAELNLISKARHAEISKGDIDNPNIKPMNLEFGRLRNWLDEISNHLDIDYWVEHDKHYEAYLRYRAVAWNEGHSAKGFMEWVAETIGMGKPATATPTGAPAAAGAGDAGRPKIGDAIEAFKKADPYELFEKAYHSGDYQDMRAAMFSLKDKTSQLEHELAAARDQVAVLSAALEPFHKIYATWLARDVVGVYFDGWLAQHVQLDKYRRVVRHWFEAVHDALVATTDAQAASADGEGG